MPTSVDARPPCIVLGLETQIGLSIVRELGRAGVRVIGIAQENDAIGLTSRYLARRLVVTEPRSQQLLRTIRALGDELGECCLIAVSEANLIWLATHHGEFGRVRPIAPALSVLDMVLDKQSTLRVAQTVGISIPETAEPQSMAEVQSLAVSFRFPAVLKWKDPAAVAGLLEAASLEMVKAEYVYSSEQLIAVGLRYQPIAQWPLVQEYCAGYGLGQFFYMHNGQPVRGFQHRRVAEWPPEGGFSSVCDTIPLDHHTDLQERSVALLRAINWEGVAMVEYRMNPITGKAVLMEINGRFWGSYPLAVECGAGFALIAYYLNSNLGMPPLPPLRKGVRSRMVATEFKRLGRIFFQPNLIIDRSFKIRRIAEISRFLIDFLRPRVTYYVWSISDPRPFCTDILNLLRKIVSRI